jgi:hypothetical protein
VLVTEHPVEEELELVLVVLSTISSSLVHRTKIGAATAVTPAKPRVFKKLFLSIVFIT